MTKKHFIALADAIRRTQPFDDSMWTKKHLHVLGDFCASQNYNFDYDRWLGYIAGTHGPNGARVKVRKHIGCGY